MNRVLSTPFSYDQTSEEHVFMCGHSECNKAACHFFCGEENDGEMLDTIIIFRCVDHVKNVTNPFKNMPLGEKCICFRIPSSSELSRFVYKWTEVSKEEVITLMAVYEVHGS